VAPVDDPVPVVVPGALPVFVPEDVGSLEPLAPDGVVAVESLGV
jgi:hypothetical protein